MRVRLRQFIVQLGNHMPSMAARAFRPTSRASRLARPLVNRVLPDGDTVVTVRSGAALGKKLQISPRSEKFYWAGQYEIEVQRAIESLLSPGDTFWDVGAHIGFFSLIAAERVTQSGAVHAFEPYAPSRRRLEANLRLNGVGNVYVHPLGLAASSGVAKMYAARESLMWTLVRGLGADSDVQVSCTTLDEQSTLLGPATLIKVDVERAELDVLRGGTSLLASERPPVLIVEFTNAAIRAEAMAVCPGWTFDRLTDRHWLLRRGSPYHGPA